MKLTHRLYLIIVITCFSVEIAHATETAFYILRSNKTAKTHVSKETVDKLDRHKQSIDILMPQSYHIDEHGTVTGYIDETTIKLAKQNHIRIIPYITNSEFNKQKVQQFLKDSGAQKKAIQSLIDLCDKGKFDGIQIDFENIPYIDRDRFTKFYSKLSNALHNKGYLISVAVVPTLFEGKAPSKYLKRKFQNWSGAYNLKALAEASDYITIMAYDQHESGTTPGPVASISFIETSIKHAIKYIPANKISLGIPTYSSYWYTGSSQTSKHQSIHVKVAYISHKEVQSLVNKYKLSLSWDNINKQNFSIFQHNMLNEYLFIENAKSFEYKLNLAKKYKLHGISVFDLANADERIWKSLSSKKKSKRSVPLKHAS